MDQAVNKPRELKRVASVTTHPTCRSDAARQSMDREVCDLAESLHEVFGISASESESLAQRYLGHAV